MPPVPGGGHGVGTLQPDPSPHPDLPPAGVGDTYVPEKPRILQARFNRQAARGLGKETIIEASATVFLGKNHRHRPMLGRVVGEYTAAGFSDLTASGECKENGCLAGPDASLGGRPNNAVICPIPSALDKAYVTLAGGGLVVADLDATPMTIVGEYGNQLINGAGCAGAYGSLPNAPNLPLPRTAYKDPTTGARPAAGNPRR